MITVVIGQRGTGKTHFLNRITKYEASAKFVDLDQHIEKVCQTSIADIFQQKGEEYFRKLEKENFSAIIKQAKAENINYYISVGGGFDCSLIPNSIRILWLRRISEQWGRIFTDRPRLNAELSPIEEFQLRAKPRAEKYAECAWEEYLLPEGLRQEDKAEKAIILNSIEQLQSGLTILPQVFKKPQICSFFLKKRLSWGLKFFEIRDDLLDKKQFAEVLQVVPKEQLLFSLRSGKLSKTDLEKIKTKVQWIDCDQTLVAQYPLSEINIISRHHRSSSDNLEDIFTELKPFEERGLHLKLAVVINNFQELMLGHQWFLASPKTRSFLPRSTDGRWQWYRLLMYGKMFIEFFREGEGSAADQPTLYQCLNARINGLVTTSFLGSNAEYIDLEPKGFAALLGEPVNHSFTPIEQGPFFVKYNCQVLAIALNETDFFSAMKILTELGLIAAAVTSPLKNLAFQWVEEKTIEASQFGSVNTLVLDKASKRWLGTNTDLQGLEILLEDANNLVTAVWGGGGTLPLLQKLLPMAQYYSAQSGQTREKNKTVNDFRPECVIWAAPRVDGKNILSPQSHWQPKKIIDLNYREDSGGRDYALRCGAVYVSGEKMFYAQAEHQRHFWQKHL